MTIQRQLLRDRRATRVDARTQMPGSVLDMGVDGMNMGIAVVLLGAQLTSLLDGSTEALIVLYV